MSLPPSAQQIESRYADWWYQVGSGLHPRDNEDQAEHMTRVCREAFLAGADYVTAHAGLNQKIATADNGTGD